jgi:N-methylhydantoinase B
MSKHPDAVVVEVVNQTLAGIVREMQESLFATGYSVAIRETHDASCAITDVTGRVLAQHTVLPLHLGAFPACVQAILDDYGSDDLVAEDAFVINHPYLGGSPHASDMAVIAPIFVDGRLFGFSGAMAHKTDIGGLVPGSNSGQAREIFHEGLLLPAVRLHGRHGRAEEIERVIAANSRTPDLVAGDLRGQVGATRLGARRVQEVCDKLGATVVEAAAARLLEWTERQVRAAVRGWPDGTYDGEACLSNDGIRAGAPVCVRVRLTIDGDRLHADFRDADDQTEGPYNIRPHLVRAICYYVLMCLVGPDLPANGGLAVSITTEFREGSVLDPRYPSPVNTYLPIALVTTEALFDAFAHAVPRSRLAESSHGGSSVTGTLAHKASDGTFKVQYEILAGAMGARFDGDGVSATSVHVRNASLTPIEIIESEHPVEVLRSGLTVDSGGPGQFRGGLGLTREYRMLGVSRRTARGGRDLAAAQGREGGRAGGPATVTVSPDTATERVLGGQDQTIDLATGDVIRFEMGGGGGYGDPMARPVDLVVQDVREGYVSQAGASRDYGVAVVHTDGSWRVDEVATAALRGTLAPTSRPAKAGRARAAAR